ncbi:MAG: hypothetical protein E6J90_29485 [Deltaproteobacteria bacterium]|nr:MAG: hypothetical protein E6J90_29485 [Deltaproteobacteria bacterium]
MADDHADDRYESYYKEKLWEMLPAIYRHEDGIAERPGTMRAFIELIAEQAAALRRSHDRLWDDAFIDLCDDWAVPYIGDLVATRMVSALNKRGRRVDVAKTIYYRRRKGTPRVLEELIADITGWEGKVVESFRFLGRMRHHLDPPLAELLDPARGWADLHQPQRTEEADGPWDRFAHTVDVRKSRGHAGRWNIPKVSFHLFRLTAYELTGVQPFARTGNTTFTFDPSGRDTQLFMPRKRTGGYSWDDWTSARPWEVPAPMGCRILGDAQYVVDHDVRAAMLAAGTSTAAVNALVPIAGVRWPTEDALHDWIAALPAAISTELLAAGNWNRLRRLALVDDCGKMALWPDAVEVTPVAGTPVARERMSSANLSDWTRTAPDDDLLVDPVLGRFKLLGAAPPRVADVRVKYWYGFGGAIGAGSHDRRATVVDTPAKVVTPGVGRIVLADIPVLPDGHRGGVCEVFDSATYEVDVDCTDVEDLTIQAANLARPYLTLVDDWLFDATTAAGIEGKLTLDGLWVGTRVGASIILRGAWNTVTIRSCTLDPGGEAVDSATLDPVQIWVEGEVDELHITGSIVPRIAVRPHNAGDPPGVIDRVIVEDSILDATRCTPDIAIELTPGTVTLRRVTVLGRLDVERLDASEALITGDVDVTDLQAGCFRFSSAPDGSRVPHPYRWVKWTGGPVFSSMRFGDPGYTWLAESAPDDIRRGAENGSEIGAWSASLNPIKEASLLRKVEEYLPFGLAPIFIRET